MTLDTTRADTFFSAVDKERLLGSLKRRTVWANAPWTLPSMASLHTGVAPGEHGAGFRVGSALTGIRQDMPTLAERLQARGFVTAAVTTNPYLSAAYGFARGFDSYLHLDPLAVGVRALEVRPVLRPLAWALRPAFSTGADGVLLHARAALRSLSSGRFFLWVHFIDPHEPYVGGIRDPGGSWRCRWENCFSRFDDGPPSDHVQASPARRDVITGLYDSDVKGTAHAVEALLEEAERLDVLARCQVVVTTDHGEELWDHGGFGHGHTLEDEVLRVPLLSNREITATSIAGLGEVLAGGEPEDAPVRVSAMLLGKQRVGVIEGELHFEVDEEGEARCRLGEKLVAIERCATLKVWTPSMQPDVPGVVVEQALKSLGYL